MKEFFNSDLRYMRSIEVFAFVDEEDKVYLYHDPECTKIVKYEEAMDILLYGRIVNPEDEDGYVTFIAGESGTEYKLYTSNEFVCYTAAKEG